MTSPAPLLPGVYYHIYNRGNNRQNIFIEERNYAYFLRLYTKHIEPVAETYAYCLLRNHFHLLIRTKTLAEQAEAFQGAVNNSGASSMAHVFEPQAPSRQFGALFNAYAKAINKAYQQTGSLFQNPFGCRPVTSNTYFTHLVTYIHQNPQKQHFVPDFRDWPYSSYHACLSVQPTRLPRERILGWFGGVQEFATAHLISVESQTIPELIGDDNDD